MATYFDVQDPAHVAMILPAEMRKAAELATVVEEVEQDILDRYTRRLPMPSYWPGYSPSPNGTALYPGAFALDDTGQTWLLLRGYAIDPADADARFTLAFRRAIAEVTGWRLQRLRRDIAAESQQLMEGKHVRWSKASVEKYPPDWDRRLREFDLRDPNYVI